MDVFQAFFLGIVQGLTEFLPVSSSGHLAVLQNVFGEVNVGFDVVVHLATLFAILVYFSRDILEIVKNKKYVFYVVLASVPIALVGFFLKPIIYDFFSDLFVVSLGFLVSGMFLFVASFAKPKKNLSIKNSFLIGLSQALAIFPGISRSGSTVSTGVLSGVKREEAIKFSFILAIPALIGANILNFSDARDITFNIFATGFVSAFFSGLLAIFIFVKYFKIERFRWLAFYCWLMAVVSFVLYQIL